MNRGFALTYTYGLDKDDIESRRFTQNHRLPSLSGYTTQRFTGWRGPNKRIGVFDQFVHPGLIAQNTSLTLGARGIDGEYGDFFPD